MLLTPSSLLRRLTQLHVSKVSADPAPHKPLLLFSVLDLVESGVIAGNPIPRSAELTYQFMTYSRIVAHRRNALDIRMPFHHLRGDGIWEPLDAQLRPSVDKKLTHFARCSDSVFAALQDPSFRQQARRILIATYFSPGEQLALATTMGIPEADLGDATLAVPPLEKDDAVQQGRAVKFRLVVVAAYAFTCCLTRHRLTTLSCGSLVDAAHIHQFADSRNNDPRNGIALSKNAHWMFDQGLWTISDNLTVQVAQAHFTEVHPFGKALTEYEGQPLQLPADPALRPSPAYLTWHRKKKFLGRDGNA